jgi:hypothetical protein
MFVYLNYFKTQNYHKYTHLLQIYVDFSCTDLSHYLSNNISGLKNANFVDTFLQDLLHRDLIVKCNKHLFVVNP